MTVGADGFKVSGIKDAIDTKINKLDADLLKTSLQEYKITNYNTKKVCANPEKTGKTLANQGEK